MQPLIALDQFVNTLIPAKHEGFGFADESISARCYRLRRSTAWDRAQRLIDALFFWQDGHCRLSYEAECNRQQLPMRYCE